MQRVARLLALLLAACAPHDPTRVEIAAGVLRGAQTEGVVRFLSVPYAAAPTGALRWRVPQPAPAWGGERSAAAFGPSCMQNISASGWGPWTGEFSPQGAVSEDCLTLSVWTPAQRVNERLPVMVWIPGGGFTDGGEAVAVTNGEALARHGIVVVSINYRVAAFGMLAHPDLPAEADGGRGNYALRDALGALRWVQANIAAFGGDPGQVTVAGQSAGGALVHSLLDMPQANGLFARAIIQSFPPGSHRFSTREEAEAMGQAYAEALGAPSAAALHDASAASALAASNGIHFDLNIDGALITDPRGATLPHVNDVPVLIGITADELSFARHDLAGHAEATSRFGPSYAALYPAATEAEARASALRRERERMLVALQRWASARDQHGRTPTYLYLWTHPLPGADAERYRAFHSSELPYVFGALAAATQRDYTAEDYAIAARMTRIWSNFVRTGDPSDAAADWSAAEDASVIMELGERFAPLPPLPLAVATFWHAYYDSNREFVF